jgi:hypothetical protein
MILKKLLWMLWIIIFSIWLMVFLGWIEKVASATTVTLTWEHSGLDVDGVKRTPIVLYRIYRDLVPVGETTEKTYVDTIPDSPEGLIVRHCWIVQAIDANENESSILIKEECRYVFDWPVIIK